jgi:hypothetical protein
MRQVERRIKAKARAAIATPPQFGKSIIISQSYLAWILGYDPAHRFRLATYNTFHSARFSDDASAELTETNWYVQPVRGKRHQFTGANSLSHFFMLVAGGSG